MELHQWLDVPENKGKATWLASQLGRSKTAVALWREGGVPMPLMDRISVLTGGQVKVDDMLRHAMRCKKASAVRPVPAPAEAAAQ